MNDLIKQYESDLKGYATHSIAWRILSKVISDLKALESAAAAPQETKVTAPSSKKKAGS